MFFDVGSNTLHITGKSSQTIHGTIVYSPWMFSGIKIYQLGRLQFTKTFAICKGQEGPTLFPDIRGNKKHLPGPPWPGILDRSWVGPRFSKKKRGFMGPPLQIPRHPSSYSQLMSKGCPITETERIVFSFHDYFQKVSQDPWGMALLHGYTWLIIGADPITTYDTWDPTRSTDSRIHKSGVFALHLP